MTESIPRKEPAIAAHPPATRPAIGIFSIVAACLSFLTGMIGLIGYFGNNPAFSGSIFPAPIELLVMGLLGVFGFALGLLAGVLSFGPGHYDVILTGFAYMILTPIIPFIMASLWETSSFFRMDTLMTLLMFGTPTITLSSLGIVFTAMNENAFRPAAVGHQPV